MNSAGKPNGRHILTFWRYLPNMKVFSCRYSILWVTPNLVRFKRIGWIYSVLFIEALITFFIRKIVLVIKSRSRKLNRSCQSLNYWQITCYNLSFQFHSPTKVMMGNGYPNGNCHFSRSWINMTVTDNMTRYRIEHFRLLANRPSNNWKCCQHYYRCSKLLTFSLTTSLTPIVKKRQDMKSSILSKRLESVEIRFSLDLVSGLWDCIGFSFIINCEGSNPDWVTKADSSLEYM